MSTYRGFSLVQLLATVLIIGVLGTLTVPPYRSYVDRARLAQAIGELGTLDVAIRQYALNKGRVLPADLGDLTVDVGDDPWGNPYRYAVVGGLSAPRTDDAGDPINTDYDLYSLGRDGATALSLVASESEDDIVRGNNGAFLGAVGDYAR